MRIIYYWRRFICRLGYNGHRTILQFHIRSLTVLTRPANTKRGVTGRPGQWGCTIGYTPLRKIFSSPLSDAEDLPPLEKLPVKFSTGGGVRLHV